MTTLSIEDLKAWLELLPKVTPGPYTYGSKYLCRYREGMYYERIAQALENEEDSPRWNTDAAHLAKCDPSTIAALIEGYIAMAEALSTFMDEHDNTYDGDPLSEGMSVFISKARSALNIGGTND